MEQGRSVSLSWLRPGFWHSLKFSVERLGHVNALEAIG